MAKRLVYKDGKAEVIPTDSPFNDGEPINIDQADTNTEE